MSTWRTIESYIKYLYSKNTKGIILSFDNPHNAYRELLSSGVDSSTVMNLDDFTNKYDNSFDEYKTQYILHVSFGETSALINDLLCLCNGTIKSSVIYHKYPDYNLYEIIQHFNNKQNKHQ